MIFLSKGLSIKKGDFQKEIYYISLYSKMRRQGEGGGSKKIDVEETSFMDDPLRKYIKNQEAYSILRVVFALSK